MSGSTLLIIDLFVLLFLLCESSLSSTSSSSSSSSPEITFPRKCCPRNYILRRISARHRQSSSSSFSCVEVGFIESWLSFLPERIFNFSDGNGRLIPLVPAQAAASSDNTNSSNSNNFDVGMPQNCSSYRVLKMENPFLYLVTTDGRLLSLGGEFELDFQLGDFCLDFMLLDDENRAEQISDFESGNENEVHEGGGGGRRGGDNSHNKKKVAYERVALICDPCNDSKQGESFHLGTSHNNRCIPTCCHHLQIGAYDDKGSFYCKNRLPVTFNPPRWGKAPSYVLRHRSLEKCEVNRNNIDGNVLDMRGHNFTLYPSNGTFSLEGDFLDKPLVAFP